MGERGRSGHGGLLPLPAVLRVRELAVRAKQRWLLQGIDFEVRRGQVVALVGPSGVGKSTVLRALNRTLELERPPLEAHGSIAFHGTPIERLDADNLRAKVGLLSQHPVVFPTSIRGNVLFGARRLERLGRAERQQRLEESLARAALWREVEHRLDEPATELSIGQQQRLCLARAIAVRPQALLLDEPTSALDRESADAVEALLRRLRKDLAIVLVTHDLDQASRLADRVIELELRDGIGTLAPAAPPGIPWSARLGARPLESGELP